MAAKAEVEKAGNESYQNDHMSKIFKEGFSFSGFERDGVYLNLGTKKYLDISGISGLDSITDGRGAVFADFDNDGDLDVFLTTIQGSAHLLFRNNVGREQGFLRVSLEGTKSGKDAYGAIVKVKTSAGILTKVKAGGAGYLSQHDPRLLFGLGSDAQAEWMEVSWPSGRKQRFVNISAGVSLKLVEGAKTYEPIKEKRFELPEPLSAKEEFLAKLKVKPGSPFPNLKFSSLKNEPKQLSELLTPGRKYLINLWATYCIPCRKEMPELQRLYGRLQAGNVEIIGISLDTTGLDPVKKFIDGHGVQYPIYIADSRLVEQVYATDEVFIPLSFVIDDQAKVLEVFSGWSKDSVEKLNKLAQPTVSHSNGNAPEKR